MSYRSNESGRFELYVQSFPEPGNKYRVSSEGATSVWWLSLAGWSPDGKHLVAQVNDPDTGYDLWVLPVGGDGPATPLLHSEYDEDNAHVSGDGQWVAYQSDESGRKEVYVQSFPDLAGKVRV